MQRGRCRSWQRVWQSRGRRRAAGSEGFGGKEGLQLVQMVLLRWWCCVRSSGCSSWQ
jgi:hypothetical protein